MAIIDKIQLSGTVYTIGNETTTAVTSASTDNEIPTAKAVYDAIPQGGGGKAVSAGTNISITTGETADTINCTLPISAGTGSESIIAATEPSYPNKATADGAIAFNGYGFVPTSATGVNSLAQGSATLAQGRTSHSEGYDTKAIGYASHSEGNSTSAMTDYSHTEGIGTKATNKSEHASGFFNISVSASTTFGDSGNTLFSVGNGTLNNGRHNAFEIRQNGDIYIADTNDTSTTNFYEKPMIKLQDALGGGGGSTYTAGDGIDITNNVISVTGKVDTSAITTTITSSSTDAQVPSAKVVYDQFGGLKLVKLTQSEYDSLTTKDSSTLYIING